MVEMTREKKMSIRAREVYEQIVEIYRKKGVLYFEDVNKHEDFCNMSVEEQSSVVKILRSNSIMSPITNERVQEVNSHLEGKKEK